jgi:hypothetical protein
MVESIVFRIILKYYNKFMENILAADIKVY